MNIYHSKSKTDFESVNKLHDSTPSPTPPIKGGVCLLPSSIKERVFLLPSPLVGEGKGEGGY